MKQINQISENQKSDEKNEENEALYTQWMKMRSFEVYQQELIHLKKDIMEKIREDRDDLIKKTNFCLHDTRNIFLQYMYNMCHNNFTECIDNNFYNFNKIINKKKHYRKQRISFT